MKIKAGALQYTIFISVLVAILVASFIGWSYANQKTRMKVSNFHEAIATTNSVYAFLGNNSLQYQTDVEIEMPLDVSGVSIASKKHWGIFDLVSTEVELKNEVFHKKAMMGGQQKNRAALYLKDNNKPLVVVGETKIRGMVYLPEKGVRRGNISGHSYHGNQLVFGEKRLSSTSLPELEHRNFLKDMTEGKFSKEKMDRIELQENKKFENLFEKRTQIFESTDAIDLRYISLSGNIIIQSHSSIKVSKSSQLADVILIAPKIVVERGVQGNFQAFASERIVVASDCILEYPTVLVVHEKANVISKEETNPQLNQENQIRINSGVSIKGTVAYLSSNDERAYQSNIFMDKGAVLLGEIYSEKNLDLQGEIKGMVHTDSFIAKQFGSVYINHIYNGIISEPELPEQFTGLSFVEGTKKVAKWVF